MRLCSLPYAGLLHRFKRCVHGLIAEIQFPKGPALLCMIFASGIVCFGQPLKKEKVIRIESFLEPGKSDDEIRTLPRGPNYLALALLDSSLSRAVARGGLIDPEELAAAKNYLRNATPVLEMPAVEADTEVLFSDRAFCFDLLGLLRESENNDLSKTALVFPVYVRDHKAVFETAGPSGGDTYYGTVRNGTFRIFWLEGTVE